MNNSQYTASILNKIANGENVDEEEAYIAVRYMALDQAGIESMDFYSMLNEKVTETIHSLDNATYKAEEIAQTNISDMIEIVCEEAGI